MMKFSPIYEMANRAGARFVEQDGWQVVEGFGEGGEETAVSLPPVAICDQTANGRIRIEGNRAGSILEADDLTIGTSRKMAYGTLYRLRQDVFFVCTGVGIDEETAVHLNQQAQNSSDLITVTNVSHGDVRNMAGWPKKPRPA